MSCTSRRCVLGGMALMAATVTGAFAALPRAETVRRLAAAVAREYQDPALGQRISALLLQKLGSGGYVSAHDGIEFASLLSEDMRSIANDKHLAVIYGVDMGAADPSTDASFVRAQNFGLQSVRRLPGNIGLIELNLFPDISFGAALFGRYAAAMTIVAETHALVVDMRKHIGGDPATVAYFVSYFFERPPFLVNEIRYRHKPAKRYLTGTPQGQRYGEHRPLLVVTSADTFSGGEEFAYDLQVLKRARIVGESTGGGANPNEPFDVGGGFVAMIPNGRAVNPVTNTNWEGVGVKPDTPVPAARALDAAHRLALEAALGQAQTQTDRDAIRRTLDALPTP